MLAALGVRGADGLSDDDLIERLGANKAAYAAGIAARLYGDASLAQRAPEAFRDAIEQLRGLT